MKKIIGVIGRSAVDQTAFQTAYEVGKLIAKAGAILICGGLTGVMEA
ncbi:MAG: TIGR00725 family protein, partial [candidate division Zixibacteria bacterium]